MTSWQEHVEAALAMGLTEREAYETYDGWPGLVKASRERVEAMTALLDAREDLEP